MRKKEKKRKEEIKTQEKTERKALIVKELKNTTSVFFHDKLILKNTTNKPFACSVCKQILKGKRKTECVQKKIPLTTLEIDKENNIIKICKEPIKAQIKLTEKKDLLYMEIENNTGNTLQINVPRGTNKKRERKDDKLIKKSIFTTKRPNLMLNDELMLSIETNYDWDIKRTNREVIIDIKGKRASLLFINCKNKEEGTQKYIEEKNIQIPQIKEKKGIYLTVNRKNYIKKVEKVKELGVKVQGIVLEDIEIREEIDKAIEFAQRQKIEIYLKMKPYIPTNIKYKEEKKELLLKDIFNKPYIQEINNKKYYGVDLSKEKARRWQQNLIRELLDKGIKGIMAEKAVYDKQKVELEEMKNFDYHEIWHIIWQKLIKEAIDEYPDRELFIRNNSVKSVRYGILMTDEKSWKDIERIQKDIDKTKLLGSDIVITEIGGLHNKREKQYKKLKKWKEIQKKMPIVIMGNVPEKIIKRLIKE